jgi:hypothetical protein
MADNKTLRSILAVIGGGILYAVLNWVPLAGPVAAGLATGYSVGGGFGRGFKHAVYASSAGAVLVAYVLSSYGILDSAALTAPMFLFVTWILIVWNLVGVFLAGIAGGFGAVGKDIRSLIPRNLAKIFVRRSNDGVDYSICPGCGQGNVSSAQTCIGCGRNLK